MKENTMTKTEIEALIKSDDYELMAKEIIGLAMCEEDYDFALKMVIFCSEHFGEVIRGNGVLPYVTLVNMLEGKQMQLLMR